MRYFFDTEFYDDGQRVWPISFGMVSEDGRELYMEFDTSEHDTHWDYEGTWLRDNVAVHLSWPAEDKIKHGKQSGEILAAFVTEEKPEFWAYFADCDWIVLYQMYGPMMQLPSHFPRICMDLQQRFYSMGRPFGVKPPKPKDAHNALADAYWNLQFHKNMDCYSDVKLL